MFSPSLRQIALKYGAAAESAPAGGTTLKMSLGPHPCNRTISLVAVEACVAPKAATEASKAAVAAEKAAAKEMKVLQL